MSLRLEANAPAALPEIVSLLRESFGVSADVPNLNSKLLHWKYFGAGPSWEGSRSYCLRKGDTMVAHACLWPIRLATPSGTSIQVIQALDWAGAKSAPGAGIILMRKFGEMANVQITMGGSADTQKVLPRIGFTQRGEIGLYARVLRPWRQFQNRPSEGRKAIPRLLRNTLWSRPPLASHGSWTSQAVPPSSQLLAAFDAQPAHQTESRYSAAFLEFMLRCPAAQVRHFALLNDGHPRGFFLLARVGGQTRLADLRILSTELDDWIAAHAVAVKTAAQDPEACELVASAPVPLAAEALEANNFRLRGSKPVFVCDPQRVLAGEETIHLSMLDDDRAYLNFPEFPYAT